MSATGARYHSLTVFASSILQHTELSKALQEKLLFLSTLVTLSNRIACSTRFLGEGRGEYTKELEEMKMAVQREQRRRKKRRGREEEGQTADKAIVINSDDSETEPSPKRVRAERSSSRQQAGGRQQEATGSGQPGEREMDVSTAAPRWKPVSSSGSHTQVQWGVAMHHTCCVLLSMQKSHHGHAAPLVCVLVSESRQPSWISQPAWTTTL